MFSFIYLFVIYVFTFIVFIFSLFIYFLLPRQVIDGYLAVSNVHMAEPEEPNAVGANQTEFLRRFQTKARCFLRASHPLDEAANYDGDGPVMPEGSGAPLAYDATFTDLQADG